MITIFVFASVVDHLTTWFCLERLGIPESPIFDFVNTIASWEYGWWLLTAMKIIEVGGYILIPIVIVKLMDSVNEGKWGRRIAKGMRIVWLLPVLIAMFWNPYVIWSVLHG